MPNFLYSINATLPIFLIMILGKLLYKLKIIGDDFIQSVDKYVFYTALPVLVFKDLTENNFRENFDAGYVMFCFFSTLASILIIWGLTELFMKNEAEKGAFIQASYRSSAAILGLAFIDNMYDGAGMAPLMILGAVPLFNIFAGIELPVFANKSLNYLANTASPLALLSIGAGFEGRKAFRKRKLTIISTLIKLFIICALFLPIAVYLGYRSQELMGILIMLGSPATVSCYIMAKNTGNDTVLTSSIIVLTTLLSSISLTFWIFILKSMRLL